MKELEITAGIIVKDKKLLIGQRKFEDKFGGKWEFPGGKLESFELPEDCIVRELCEELGISVKKSEHFLSYTHEYASVKLVVHSFVIREFDGEITLNDHEKVAWIEFNQLKSYDFLEADKEIINKLIEKGSL